MNGNRNTNLEDSTAREVRRSRQRRQSGDARWAKAAARMGRLVIFSLICLIFAAIPRQAPGQDNIARAKALPVEHCERVTLAQMASSFFDEPRWEERGEAGGAPLISVWGRMSHPNPEGVYARLWYGLEPDKGLIYQYIDFSGLKQADWIYLTRLANICQLVE